MRKKTLWLLIMMFLAMVTVAGGGNQATAAENNNIEAINFDLCPSVEITKVSYYMKDYKGAPRLHFDVTIKNVSAKAKRFRLAIFLPDGTAGGGFYPRKGKPPVIKPGAELTRTFPMYFHQFPSAYTIRVQEL
ncbi:MAG: hypothetical protein U9P07_12080 [Pseudomonadota bacterium]|nr:hypothetical protein [Pseudomonadota bacterium]